MIAIPDMDKPKSCDEYVKSLDIECCGDIRNCPLIDIVRCGECIYHDDGICRRPKWAMGVEPTGFCSYGERRSDEYDIERD